uniref:16S rRNA (guanine(527)-N(7))-methyltransferase RsmG n=1 Tax=Ningiella ruwaisensis TaxID=2364274 RepID=UPI0010A0013A|nr:16S rRNA (guanine(527)-N(7))-methyltransferase RsmG [Ningiella ruwaisensis]
MSAVETALETELNQQLEALIRQTQLKVSVEKRSQLVRFVLMMHKWNKAYNLSSVREPQQMLIKHIMDSLVVLPHLHKGIHSKQIGFEQVRKIADVGTGPGLPGIPLAIMCEDIEFTLIDSLGKRIRFIKQVCFELGIKNVQALHTRVENVQQQDFDLVLSRAFASLEDMLSWCAHLVAHGGEFLALKGHLHQDELAKVPAAFSVAQTYPLLVPSLEGERHLVRIIRA